MLPTTGEAGSAPMTPWVASKFRVLVVEDDDELLSVIVEFLEEEGFEVAARADTISGLVRLMALGADVVVLDWKMSGLDGFDLLRTLHRCYPGVPVIFTTAYATEDVGGRALGLGAISFLPKPFKREELVAHVEGAIRSGRSDAKRAVERPEPSSDS